jgi:hypothetical protein
MMDKLIQDGVVGIVTGIVTTVILYLAKMIWVEKLFPLLQESQYSGIKMDGKWFGIGKGKVEEEEWKTEMVLFLSQSALNLKGTYSLKHESQSINFELNFYVHGHIWEGYVILNFTPIDRRVTSYATSLLKISDGGKNLIGKIAYRDVKEDKVTAEGVWLHRAK